MPIAHARQAVFRHVVSKLLCGDANAQTKGLSAVGDEAAYDGTHFVHEDDAGADAANPGGFGSDMLCLGVLGPPVIAKADVLGFLADVAVLFA